MKRVAVMVLLCVLLGVAACGEDNVVPAPESGLDTGAQDGERARALEHVAALARRIERGLTPAPCGTDPLDAMGRVGDALSRLIHEHLYRSDWPLNGDMDGPYPKDGQVRRAAMEVVCRTLPQLRMLAACEQEEVRHNAMAVLCNLRHGGPYAPKTCPPEWPQLLRAFEAELGHYVRLTSSPDARVREYAAELVFLVAPRSAEAWQIAQGALAGRGRLSAWDVDRMIGLCDAPAHFTPLLVDAVLRGLVEDGRTLGIDHPFEVPPSAELAERMRAVLCGTDDERRVDVLAAVATPLCLDFLDEVLGILEHDASEWLRADAAITLAGMGTGAAAAVPALVRCLASDERRLRMCALRALTTFHVPSAQAVEAILAALERGGADDRSHLERCIDALGACGAGVPAAQEALRRLAASPRFELAKRARAALARAAEDAPPR